MSPSPLDYLKHISDEREFILNSTHDLTKENLLEEEVLKRALVRSLEIIGEASKKIPADWKIKWSQIEWKNIAGMRDRLIHDYMGINYNIVWDVVINKIPSLKIQISEVIDSERL